MKNIIAAMVAILFPFLAVTVNEPAPEREIHTITIPADENGEVPNTYIISIPAGEKKETPDVYNISAPEGDPVDEIRNYTIHDEKGVFEIPIPAEAEMQTIQGKAGEVQYAYCTVYFIKD